MRIRAAPWPGALALAAAALVGCATPLVYGPMSEHGGMGYRDMQNADGSYTITVVTNSEVTAREFWERRAGELCGGGFRRNLFRAQRPVVTMQGYASNGYGGGGSYTQDAYGSFQLEGYARCDASTEPAPASPPVGNAAMPDPTAAPQ